jgi:hypothetical protein
LEPPLLHPRIVVGVQVINADNLIAMLEKFLSNLPADEASRSCYKNIQKEASFMRI